MDTDKVGFKISGGVAVFDKEVIKTGQTEVVLSPVNCVPNGYEIWKQGIGILPLRIGSDSSLDIINRALNLITDPGKYYVNVLCNNNLKVTSNNLVVN